MARHHKDIRIALTAAQRQAQALELRRQGLTYQEIADQAGYKTRSGAQRAVERALDQITIPAADRYRREQLDRTMAVIRGLWPRAQEGDPQAAQALIRAMAQLDKHTGLDFHLEELARRDTIAQAAAIFDQLATRAQHAASDHGEKPCSQ
jgi:hypothetical protein